MVTLEVVKLFHLQNTSKHNTEIGKLGYVHLPIHNFEFVLNNIAPLLEIPFTGTSPSTEIKPIFFLRLTSIVCHSPSLILVWDLNNRRLQWSKLFLCDVT